MTDSADEHKEMDVAQRVYGMPPVILHDAAGVARPCPYLMNYGDVADFFRLHDSNTRFPRATINRYRKMGLRNVRVGRRVWFRLDDVLRFLDFQQLGQWARRDRHD